jgi:hypothetical protein
MKQYICILISCLIGGILVSGTSSASICDNKETIVFFGNGIKTIKTKAYNSSKLINKQLKLALPTEDYEVLDFKISYNETGGGIRDLFESTIQSLTLDASRFWRILWGREIMPDWFVDKLLLLSTVLDKSALVTTDSLKDHVSTYTTKIAEGKKVLLVAHSQGNFFGNQAYNLLDSRERQSFAMVSVANPDNTVLDDDSPAAPYTTLVNDKVIQAIIVAQILLPTKPMEPNTVNLVESDDSLQHNFIDTYMVEGSDSNVGVLADIVIALDSLVAPPQIVESGVITVALNWGMAPDVDLHVYEPNGTHVSWYNLDGVSGKLDKDDTTRFGPEHYRVLTCDKVEEGGYHIALDYYKGDYPEVAILQIDAGLVSRTIEIPMESDIYGTPNYPKLVANIWAHKTEDNGYEFLIYE